MNDNQGKKAKIREGWFDTVDEQLLGMKVMHTDRHSWMYTTV